MKANEEFENENVGNETNLKKTTFLQDKIFNFLRNKGIVTLAKVGFTNECCL